MHTLGKVVILLLAVGAFLFQGCKKDAVSNTDRIKGVWRMESSFWDKDSNGLDSGDEVYMVKPSDTILWNFLGSGIVEYYTNNRKTHEGIWAISESNKTAATFIILNTDLEGDRYLYKLEHDNNNSIVLYCKKEIVFFSSVYYKWMGFKITKI